MHDPANGLPRTHQRVEKVGVDQVGGAREPENASGTLRKLRIPPLDRGPKKARRSFSTRCPLPRTPLNKEQETEFRWLRLLKYEL